MHPIGVKLGSEKHRYPVGAGVGLGVVGTLASPREEGELRTRRGGGRVVRGGDACVALAGGGTRAQGQDEGDASVPTPLHTTPAPTNVTICPQKTSP